MATLLSEQKKINITPVINLTVGSTSLDGLVGRYKYRQKADSIGRASIWLDNTGGRFDDLAGDYPDIVRGAEVVISRGLRTKSGQVLTADLPTLWIETIMFVFFRKEPYLVLDCIDWVNRLRFYRYAATTTWTAKLIEEIASDILGEVGLTLASGAFSTALSIDFSVSPHTSGWTALRKAMTKVPEVLYANTGKEIGWKTLDPTATVDYSYDLNPSITSDDHPVLNDSDVAEASARYNSITVTGGASKEFTGSAEDSAEIALMGYRRRRLIIDRTLGSDQECADRAAAELDFWTARGTAGVVVARPHFTVKLFDVVSAPAPIWGGPVIGKGHVTRIVEWYNVGRRDYDQALTLGEVPDAALIAIGDDQTPVPPKDDDPGDPGGGDEDDAGDSSGEDEGEDVGTDDLADGSVTTPKIADDAVTSAKIADNSITNAMMQNNAIDTAEIVGSAVTSAEIATGAVDTLELAADAVTGAKIVDNAVDSEHIAGGAVDAEHFSALPSTRVYKNSSTTISDATETFLAFNTERWDTDGIHSTSSNTGRLTAVTAGKYLVTAELTLDFPLSGTAVFRVDLVKNGSTIIATQMATRLVTIDENLQVSLSSLIEMAVDDYVRVRVYHTGYGDTDLLAGSSSAQNNQDFMMHFVSG